MDCITCQEVNLQQSFDTVPWWPQGGLLCQRNANVMARLLSNNGALSDKSGCAASHQNRCGSLPAREVRWIPPATGVVLT